MKTPLVRVLAPLMAALLIGCATAPAPRASPALLHDDLFAEAPPRFDAASVFALSDTMRQQADAEFALKTPGRDPRRMLIDALYAKDRLRLEYDSDRTRTAAEAYEAKAGNCLSLVLMTAAFARHLGLPVSFQRVVVDRQYRRSQDLTLVSNHVNLVLAPVRAPALGALTITADADMVVDFLPQRELRHARTQPLPERTILAMFLNNRAAEALGQGRLSEAYGWARDAVLQDDGFAAAANTLGVIYQRAGHPAPAEAALRHAAAADPLDPAPLSNLVALLNRNARHDEAQSLQARLDRLQPVTPFKAFDLGRQAMAAGDYAAAAQHFARELRAQPHQDEVHFWAAQAHWQLGDRARALRHLEQAHDNSDTRINQTRYAAKLDHLRAHLTP